MAANTSAGAALIAKALGVAVKDVPSDARMDEYALWDSFSHEQILTELEKPLAASSAPTR